MNAIETLEKNAVGSDAYQSLNDFLRRAPPTTEGLGDALDENGWTALMHAAAKGDARRVQALLPASDPMRANAEGDDALMLAVASKSSGARGAIALLADLSAFPEEALVRAVEDRWLPGVKALAEHCDKIYARPAPARGDPSWDARAEMKFRSRKGETAATLAAKLGWAEGVQELARRFSLGRNERGETVLMMAASSGSAEAVAEALPHGDPKARSSDGSTALMFASRSGSVDAAQALLPHSDPSAKDARGMSAAEQARQKPLGQFIDDFSEALVQKAAQIFAGRQRGSAAAPAKAEPARPAARARAI